ncbi:hypothetical protein BKA80DRAFT_287095 [Phyllosticta citrichinensis]
MVTSLVTNAQNNSALECWKFTTPLTSPSTPGISGSMFYAFNLSTTNQYTVIPARFDGGIHNAPAPQFVFFASGLAHLSLPHGDDEAWILGGVNGLTTQPARATHPRTLLTKQQSHWRCRLREASHRHTQCFIRVLVNTELRRSYRTLDHFGPQKSAMDDIRKRHLCLSLAYEL